MASSNLKPVKEAFFDLNKREQSALIGEIYKFSKDMKLFLENRLLGVETKAYFEELEAITYERFGAIPPKWVDARKVNAVISKANKAKVGDFELFKLHLYVFEAYVVWIDMFEAQEVGDHLIAVGVAEGSLDVSADRHVWHK